MDEKRAFSLLGLSSSASPDLVERVFQQKWKALHQAASSAPNEGLRREAIKTMRLIQSARAIALSFATITRPPAPPEKTEGAPGHEDDQVPDFASTVPDLPSAHRSTGRVREKKLDLGADELWALRWLGLNEPTSWERVESAYAARATELNRLLSQTRSEELRKKHQQSMKNLRIARAIVRRRFARPPAPAGPPPLPYPAPPVRKIAETVSPVMAPERDEPSPGLTVWPDSPCAKKADSGDLIGQTLFGFKVEKKLGEGAMGTVYLATHLRLGRKVAIKALPPHLSKDEQIIERFEREARLLASLDSAFVIPIHDMFKTRDVFCIVMGYAEGGSVRDLLQRQGKLSVARATSIGQQTALGLWAAAEEGIVHRDIKPDNLLLSKRGRVKIADFGLGKAMESAGGLTKTGCFMGTAAYMSPEQWTDSRSARHASDLYALGCTLFELLSGNPPFAGPSISKYLKQHLVEPPPDLRRLSPRTPAALLDVVRRLIEKDPEKRFATGREVARRLAPFIGAEGDDGHASSGMLLPV